MSRKEENPGMNPSLILFKKKYEVFKDKPESKDTYTLVSVLGKHFVNVEVMNMHKDGKDNNEEFFCDVIPSASRACEAVKKRKKNIQHEN
eukprot:7189226-Ditylum_brightwellii.AAC.1